MSRIGDKINVLVLGVGGNVSQGILKALAISSLPCKVVGACVSPTAFGLFAVDRAILSPLATDAKFVPWLLNVCKDEGIDVILSGVEPVLKVLARNAALVRQATGAITIVSTPEQLAIADDKLKTCEWLKAQGFHYPRFAAAEDPAAVEDLVDSVSYPLIAKPRNGKSSEGILFIRNRRELDQCQLRADGYVIEEYLGTADEEYTATCFSDIGGVVRGCIAFRRDLLDGTTVRAEAGLFPVVREESIRIATALRPLGSCNMQMRKTGSKAVCFEINLRFSGTTSVRARLGFNDVEACLRHYVMKEPARDLPIVESGIMTRYWNELYVSTDAVEQLRRDGRLESPRAFPSVVEDYGR